QLSAYGLPTHDDALADLPDWQAWIASQPQQDCDQPAPSTFQPTAPPQDSGAEPDIPAGNLAVGVTVRGRQTLNWAGNAATGARGTYHRASMKLYVPDVHNAAIAVAASWTGLGGDGLVTTGGSLVLVQAGILVSPGSFSQDAESVVEVYPQV